MKFKYKTMKKIQGSISVLLVIILLPMMTFSALIVDMSRINMAKQMMSSAGDLAMNTALANYDTILKDVYGLFAMSQVENMSNDELGEELNKYFAKTLSSYGVVAAEDADDYVATLIGDFRDILNEGTVDTTNFLELNNISLEATKVEGSSLANASILRKQVVEYMKYRAPLGVGVSFLESLTSFEKMDAQTEVVEAQVKAQESTQDVTKACQLLIQMIRAYDKRVEEIDDALNGVSSSTDTEIIPLEDYDSHVMKYQSAWGENYAHINQLNLIFQANSPSVDNVYLKALSYGSQYYVNFNGEVYSGTDTGINVQVSLAGDATAAATQIADQITNLNNNYKQYADRYTASMLPSGLLKLHSNNYSDATILKENEEAAIKSFIAFEKFLLDQSENGSITYSQVKAVLEQIYTLDKYRANYEAKIDAEISKAESNVQEAQDTYDTLVSNRSNAEKAMKDRITHVNNTINNYVKQFENLDAAVAFLSADGSGTQNKIKAVLNTLPAYSGGYRAYYNSNIAYGSWDKYIEYFSWLVNSSSLGTSGTKEQKKIITEARNYVEKNGYDANGFDSYMKNKLSDAEESEDLFKLLCCLKTSHAYMITYKNNISNYENANNAIPGAEQTLSDAKETLAGLKAGKESTLKSVTDCLRAYNKFCTAYQADAYYYGHYITAAKNTIAKEAQAIQTHFSQLITYVGEIRTGLNAISEQITTVKNAIKTYNENLSKWDEANTSYQTNNGGDSFSSQTSDDIDKARTEYDADLYDTLDTFVIAMWNEYDDLYSKLTESTNFTYGTKRIDAIATAEDLKSAVSGTQLSAVVTIEEADLKLSSLYSAETIEYDPYTMDYSIPKQLGFLGYDGTTRILQIQALKYLNSAYPDDSELTEEQKTANKTQEKNYEDAKDKLTGKTPSSETGDSGETEDTSGTGDEVDADFGYTFDSNKLLGNLPSNSTTTDKKEFSDSEYLLQETGEGEDAKLDASSGVSGQTDKSSSVLSGIGDIATTAVENLYILNYVFENFSYNTIIQEQILEDHPTSSNTVIGQIGEAEISFSDAEIVTAAKDKITTLSNFSINEKNNHLFGGEIEYILFGNATPSKNVTSAKASIYAIRFGFNCIFAFTDSEIRNTTMAAGLAVQAATLGIVPYQVVQIVLQLALAAAESAVDLSAMNHGLSVAIIKTRDTWSLSMSGASNVVKDAAQVATEALTSTATDYFVQQVNSVTNGLNDLVDAGADKLKDAIVDLGDNMTSAAEGVLEGVADNVLSAVMSEIEEGLNELQYVKVGNTTAGEVGEQIPTKTDVRAQAEMLFQNLRQELPTIVASACGDNQMALSISSALEDQANVLINEMEQEVLNTIDSANDNIDITGYIAGQLNSLKMILINKANEFIHSLENKITNAATDVVDQSTEQLKDYISQCGEDLSEEAADAIKKEISDFTDNFVNTTLQVNSTTAVTDVKSSPVSMFQFGYKDYLMLLTYISICCGDSVLLRTADVIQMNLQSADQGADFSHKANTEESKFLMSKAYTYISITATADLDMFFMDLDIFADQVEGTEMSGTTEETVASTEESSGTQIIYKGLLGY